jgi:hypothetical protein
LPYQQVGFLVTNIDTCAIRQVGGIGQNAALVFWLFVENINVGAQ